MGIRNIKTDPSPGAALDLDRAAEKIHVLFDDVQTETDAAMRAFALRVLYLMESLKNGGSFARRDSDASVGNFDL